MRNNIRSPVWRNNEILYFIFFLNRNVFQSYIFLALIIFLVSFVMNLYSNRWFHHCFIIMSFNLDVELPNLIYNSPSYSCKYEPIVPGIINRWISVYVFKGLKCTLKTNLMVEKMYFTGLQKYPVSWRNYLRTTKCSKVFLKK